MNLLLSASFAHAQPSATLVEGESLLAICLDDPACGPWWRGGISEALLELGLALHHEPMITSALAGKGSGPVLEVGLDTVALGPRNDIARLAPLVPAVPRLAAGLQLGGSDFDAPRPQLVAGIHGTPPLSLFGSTLSTLGATASASIPIEPWAWAGAQLSWTSAWAQASLLEGVQQLQQVQQLVGAGVPTGGLPGCGPDGCVDRLTQHTLSVQLGGSLEPTPGVFAIARGGLLLPSQHIELQLDGTRWRLAPPMPAGGLGLGLRAGDRWQLSTGLSAALKPRPATTGGRTMVKLVVASGFRFGPARTRAAAGEGR